VGFLLPLGCVSRSVGSLVFSVGNKHYWRLRYSCVILILVLLRGPPQEINARAHAHTIALYLQHEITQQFSRNYFKSDLYKLNCIYKYSETSSLSTTISTQFSSSLKHEKQNKTTKVNLHSVIPHVRNRHTTMQ